MKEERKNLIDNLNRMYCSQSQDYKEQYREEYSFNIPSELFQQLTKEQQVLWRKEIENTFNNVYHQAEKDNELTWEDMRELYIIFAEVDTEIELCKTDITAETLGYYQEVLKRFKERKEK